MSADAYRDMLRRWPPGRRVTFKDGACPAPSGAGRRGGLLLYPVPVPDMRPIKPDSDDTHPEAMRLGLAVEVVTPSGFDLVVMTSEELELEPFDAERIRQDLYHRFVEFPHTFVLGLPSGAKTYGLIEDVSFPDQSVRDASVEVKIDVEGNPDATVHHVTADFTQCQLKLRTK